MSVVGDATSSSALAEGARALAALPGAEAALQAIVDLAMAVTECNWASITLVGKDGSVGSPASSDEMARRADQLQYELGEGPCLQAAESRGLYTIVDTERDDRWPAWGPAVAAIGVHSVLSVNLFTDRKVLGALNLYFHHNGEFSDEQLEIGRVVAAHASAALARIRGEQELWRAIDSRHLIGQAQGLLMERFSLSSEKAFAVLRRYSQQHNIKLHDIAATLVRTGALPDGGDRLGPHDGAARDGSARDGAARDGAARDGSASNGAVANGVTRSVVPGPSGRR